MTFLSLTYFNKTKLHFPRIEVAEEKPLAGI